VRWLELSCRVDSEAVEAVSEVFARYSSGGIAVEPEITSAPDDGFTLGTSATVRAYLPVDDQARVKAARVDEALGHLNAIWPIGSLNVAEIDEADWANAWKSHYHTFRVGRRIVVRPSWQAYEPAPDDVVVSLDPGAAFGTGLHPTTRRCLELLDETVKTGDHVLDVGTGSGILAIAAIGLGAADVVAIDIDPLAVSVAAANATTNQLRDRIVFAAATLDALVPNLKFDVVVANIIARVIVEIAPRLAGHVAENGTLITSGVIAERADDVEAALARCGLVPKRVVDGDWVSFVATPRAER
jgi:ribosomal protein L11 methyltransferase